MDQVKVAVVTGAGRGIGRSIALRLAQDGFHVAVNDRDITAVEKVADEIRSIGQRSIAIPADVSDKEQVFNMVETVEKTFNRLDVMVSNAGIVQVKPLLEIDEQDLEKIFRINVFGVLYCMQAAAKVMIKQNSGKIINASSIAGKRGTEFIGHYSASKFSVIGLSQSAAKEFAKYGITVNAYCPGVVGTQMWEEIDEELSKLNNIPKGEAIKKRIEEIRLGRIEKPEDVAGLVSYLASEDANYLTGQSIVIDGGIVFS